MAAAGPAGECYRVGDLTVDVGLQRVTGPVGDIALPRLSFDLLLALLRRAPDFVSNDDLSATVWVGVVVSPETVTKRVNLLREAIGDDASNPRYVAGLRSRGYRMACPVAPLQAERMSTAAPATVTGPAAPAPIVAPAGTATPVVSSTPALESQSARASRQHSLIAAASVLLAGVMASAWWMTRAPDALPPTTAAESRAAALADSSVAVLRFKNLSPDPADAYLAAGVPEMILDRLATVPGLTVIASGSALGIESDVMTAPDVMRRLGARYLVEGSAQREGDSLRVTVRLIDAASATQLWSSREERSIEDLFVLQDAIAAKVAEALASRLTGLAALRPVAPSTPIVEAQLAFLQGRALLARGTVGDSGKAVQKFRHAIELDPKFAAGLAGLYDAHLLVAERRHEDLAAEQALRAPLIERALMLDPACGSAYVARAIWRERDDAAREADFKRGLELDPSNSRGLVAYSTYLRNAGRSEDADRTLERALQVDPLSPRVQFTLVQRKFNTDGGLSLEQGMRRVLDIDPDFQPALQRYAKYRWMHHGKLAEAAQLIEHAIEVDPENPWSRHTAAAIYLDLDDPGSAKRVGDGTDSSRQTTQILLSLRAGDWRTAGELALGAAGRRYNPFESWGVPEATRDWALQTGDSSRVIAFYEERYGLREGGKLQLSNFRAASCLASLLLRSGEHERADRLLRQLPGAIEATLERDGPVYSLRTIASVKMLLGDRQAALATLADSFRANDLTQWWYTLERDPVWEPVRQSAEFQAIEREVRARVAHEQSLLEESRQQARIALHPSEAKLMTEAAAR